MSSIPCRGTVFFSVILGSRQRTNSLPLWGGILDIHPVALPVPFPVTLQALRPVALPVLLLPALPLLLPVELAAHPVNLLNLIEFLFCVLLPFVTLAFVKLAVWKTVH